MRQPQLLLIDDEPALAAFVAHVAEDCGFESVLTSEDRTFREKFLDQRPDMVALDLGMPGMDGFETCRRMREAGSGAYIVALTGWGQDKDRRRVLRSGFDAHLTKPADPAQLEELLATGRLKKQVASG